MRTTLAMGTVNLKAGLLWLFCWSKDFNKYSQSLTHAQVWIRLLDLPHEYWLDRILMEIVCYDWKPAHYRRRGSEMNLRPLRVGVGGYRLLPSSVL